MKTFKTQREIYQALLDGKTVVNQFKVQVYLKDDGRLNNSYSFDLPEDWSIKCEQHDPIEDTSVCKNCRIRLKRVWVEA